MNTKAPVATCLLAILGVGTISAHAETAVVPKTYSYGSHLDIQNVISITQDNSMNCGVVDARLTYLDSAGKTNIVDYTKSSETCNNEGS